MKEIFVLLRHIFQIVSRSPGWQETVTIVCFILNTMVDYVRFPSEMRVEGERLAIGPCVRQRKPGNKDVVLTAREAALLVGTDSLRKSIELLLLNLKTDAALYEDLRNAASCKDEIAQLSTCAEYLHKKINEAGLFLATLPEISVSADVAPAARALGSLKPEGALSLLLDDAYVLEEVRFAASGRGNSG